MGFWITRGGVLIRSFLGVFSGGFIKKTPEGGKVEKREYWGGRGGKKMERKRSTDIIFVEIVR